MGSILPSFCSMEYSAALFLAFDLVPGFLLYVVIMSIGFILAPILICCKKDNSNVYAIVEYTFGSILRGNRNDGYILSNYQAPHSYTKLLFIFLIQLFAAATVEFFDDLMLEESYSCTTNGLTCCYNENYQFVDCSNESYLEENNIDNIICYSFVFRLGTAIASTLGIVTVSALVIIVTSMLLLHCSKGKDYTTCQACCTVITQISAVLGISLGAFLLCALRSITQIPNPVKMANICFEIVAIAFVIIFNILTFPWCKFKRERQQTRNDQLQEPTTVVLNQPTSVVLNQPTTVVLNQPTTVAQH